MRLTHTAALCVTLIVSATALAYYPVRQCNVQPAQSQYTHYVTPTSYTSNGSYHQYDNSHVRKRVDVQLIQVAQLNPAYTSAYSPESYDSNIQSDLLAEIRRIGARLDANAAARVSQTAELARLAEVVRVLTNGKPATTGTAPAPQPAPPTPATTPPAPPAVVIPKGTGGGAAVGLAIFNAKCAACHQSGKLATDQRFTLLDGKGNLATLTDKQKLKVVLKAYSGAMPPPKNSLGIPPLTDEEVAAIIDAVQ